MGENRPVPHHNKIPQNMNWMHNSWDILYITETVMSFDDIFVAAAFKVVLLTTFSAANDETF